MKTWPIYDAKGIMFAFEVPNAFSSPQGIARCLKDVASVTDVKPRKLFRGPYDLQVLFRFNGEPFMVWEPYGDSSRCWIGPEEQNTTHIDITPIEQAFAAKII